jgi:hypothetical protein
MAGGVDPEMQTVQAPQLEASVDRPLMKSHVDQLRASGYPMLSFCEIRDSRVGSPSLL